MVFGLLRRGFLGATFAAGVLGCGLLSAMPAAADTTLLNVSYDPTREFYVEYNKAFAEYWKSQGGDALKVSRIVVLFERKWGVRVESRRFVFESLAQLAAGIELEAMRGAAAKGASASNGGRARGLWKRLAGMWR